MLQPVGAVDREYCTDRRVNDDLSDRLDTARVLRVGRYGVEFVRRRVRYPQTCSNFPRSYAGPLVGAREERSAKCE